MTEKKPMKRGQGKRQFFACLDRIQELAGKGYTPLLIHEVLTKDGLITLSYAGFYDLLTQRKRRKKQGAQLAEPGLTPLFPISPPTQPAFTAGPVTETKNQQPVSNVPIKPPPLLPVQQSGQRSATTEQRMKTMQERLNESIRANTEHVNSLNSDPGLQKELDRLRGEE